MRISFVMWQHSTFPEEFPEGALGGAETATWHLARWLSKKHEVQVLTRGLKASSSRIGDIELVRIPSAGSKWIAGDLYYRRAMKIASDCDVVEAITCIEPAFYGRNVALHLENDLDPYLPFPAAKNRVYQSRLNRLIGVTGVSRYVSRRFAENFDYAGRISTVLNGADCREYDPGKRDRLWLGRKYKVDQDDLVAVYAGAIHKRKGLHVLLDAVEQASSPGMKLLILGGLIYSKKRDSDRRYLDRQLMRIRGDPSAVYVGPVSKQEMAKILASSDVFICPSTWEDPCPLVCAEAQASGIPVLGFNRGGIPELVEHGRTGFIMEPDPGNLARCLLLLDSEPRLLRSMGRRARVRAKECLDWSVLARRLEAFLLRQGA